MQAGRRTAAGTAAPGAGDSPDRLQQAAGGNGAVFFNSWFDIMKAEQPPKQPRSHAPGEAVAEASA